MAKYIKFDLTAPGGATGDQLLINIDDITRTASPTALTTDIFFDDVVANQTKWTITHLQPLVANDVLNAINSAITANPGGVVSTVGGPVSVAQVPQQPSISGAQGRQPITVAQVNVTYTSAAYTP
jgi:hypothetical protein